MRRGEPRPRAMQLLAQRARRVVGLIGAAPLQLGHDELDDIDERLRRHRVCEVEAVHVGLVDPRLQIVGDLARVADRHRPEPADAAPARDLAHRPLARRIGARQRLDGRLDRVALDVLEGLVKRVFRQIDAGPAGHQRECALVARVAAIVGVLRVRVGRRAARDHRVQVEDQHVARIAAKPLHARADVGDERLEDRARRRGDEDALRVLRGEVLAAPGRARLIEHRRALRRRLAQMDARHVVIAAAMVDRMHLRRLGEHAARGVAHDRAVLPRTFPQLVANLEILVGDRVALVVIRLPRQPEVARGAVEIRRDDVPADAPARQMIERRHAPRERIGMLIRQRARDAEAEMPRRGRHRGHEQDRIVDGHLRALPDRRFAAALVDVVDAEHVGDEQAVELAALEQSREPGPVAQLAIAPRLVARMRPEPGRLMADAVHVEGVETDLPGHGEAFSRYGRYGRYGRCVRTRAAARRCGAAL
ncbi:Uncharacterised protein [Burkholderia pseudomallei]|nr:Uncharacterised protein [Burkholderia pseudomallei]CAJ4623395.1 Uncharacterised protein [Burkholderia pseudomallei]